jgi:hypothetical protein
MDFPLFLGYRGGWERRLKRDGLPITPVFEDANGILPAATDLTE